MTQTLRVRSRVEKDGMLHLHLPVGTAHAEYEVVVILQPASAEGQPEPADNNSWPPGFIDATAGSIQDESFVRQPQGEYETRLDFE
jgi:hypothetical protein